jgi:hypothetical protein
MLINRTCFTYADAESVEDIIAGIEWTDDNSSTGTAQTLTAFMESKTSQVKPVFARSRNGPYTAGLAMTGIGGPAVFILNILLKAGIFMLIILLMMNSGHLLQVHRLLLIAYVYHFFHGYQVLTQQEHMIYKH